MGISVYAVLVNFMDKAIQNYQKVSVVSCKGFKSKPFSLKKSAFKIFILKVVKMKFLTKTKGKIDLWIDILTLCRYRIAAKIIFDKSARNFPEVPIFDFNFTILLVAPYFWQ